MKLPDIETVASFVHEAWVQSKRTQGFTSRMAEDGEELMVPYRQLSEKAKELDRATVNAVYEAIRQSQRACFWRHRWGQWQDKEVGAKTAGSKETHRVLGILIIQERRCGRCKQVQLRMEEASL